MSDAALLGIAIRGKSRAPMELHQRAEITVEAGVVGDFRGRPGSRQVTVLAREAWEAAGDQLDQELPWTVRRANLLVEGIDLFETTGRLIKIGQVGREEFVC